MFKDFSSTDCFLALPFYFLFFCFKDLARREELKFCCLLLNFFVLLSRLSLVKFAHSCWHFPWQCQVELMKGEDQDLKGGKFRKESYNVHKITFLRKHRPVHSFVSLFWIYLVIFSSSSYWFRFVGHDIVCVHSSLALKTKLCNFVGWYLCEQFVTPD